MKSKDLLLGLIILVLAILVIILWVRSATNSAKAEAAGEMTASVIRLLQEYEYPRLYTPCRSVTAGRPAEIRMCIETALSSQDLSGLFTEEKFQNTDAKKGQGGFLIIENAKGGKTFQSGNFTLLYNNEEIASGCTTPGEIAPGYTCRLDFAIACQPGDNLEIRYAGKRAHLKTC